MPREWLDRGIKADSPIDAFRDFWTGFNRLYASKDNTFERIKIATYLNKFVLLDQAKKINTDHSSQIQYLLSQPVDDMRGNGKNTTQDIHNHNASADDLEKLICVFMIIYQVRCNLEHGQKLPSNMRDVQLREDSAPIVRAVLEHCITTP